MGRGFAALDAYKLERAVKVADLLLRLRNSSGYEIKARSLWEMGDRDPAIEVLREGTKHFPGVFPLWEYLGTYLSDIGYYGDAIDALQKCRACDPDVVGMSDYNIAVVYRRQGRYQEALDLLETIKSGVDDEMLAGAIADSLNQLGRFDEALAVAKSVKNSQSNFLLGERAYSKLKLGRVEEAVADSMEALEFDKSLARAAEVLRLARDQRSTSARSWRILVEGKGGSIPKFAKNHGFFATYFVVAENPADSLPWLSPFEADADADSLSINSVEDLGPAPDQLLGVEKAIGGHTYFPIRNENRRFG